MSPGVVVSYPPFLYIFLFFPPKSTKIISWVDVTIHQAFALAVATCISAAVKYICFPFKQFIELSAISEPARLLMGLVKAEMERELSGASCPRGWGTGICTRVDGSKRRGRGSWMNAQRLLWADRSVPAEMSLIPLEIGEMLWLLLGKRDSVSVGLIIR